jgi:hypothetical protein
MKPTIKEGNAPRYYYAQRFTAPQWLADWALPTDDPAKILLFQHPGDASRLAARSGWSSFTIEFIDLPYVIEYQDGVWQKARRYVDQDSAMEAWPGMIEKAKRSSLSDRVWRLTSELTGEVLKVWDGAE